MRLFFFFLCLSTLVQSAKIYPFVILPPFIRNGTTNSIIVTPIKATAENVDINLVITAVSGSVRVPIFSQKYKSQKAGAARTFKFDVTTSAELAEVKIEISKHEKFSDEVRIRPDIGAIHLHTGKNIYRAGEVVEVRALPLTAGGSIFTGPVDVTLVNPDGYELTRHRITASPGTFVPLQFELPLHLFFGDWRIIARPAGFRDLDLTYETAFTVRDYELPPFQLKLYLGEDDPLDKTGMTVEASYFHGTPVDGTLVFFCSPHSKNHSTKSHRLLQTEISSGFWTGKADLSPCFDSSRLPASITVEARDKGTGGRGEATLEHDPLRPGFDIVPMRPAFDNKTDTMLFVTQPLGAPASSSLKVQFSCLSGERVAPMDLTARVGNVVEFNIPLSWNICPVIMVQAHRSVNTDQSRSRVLMIPSVTPDRHDKSVVEASWITVKEPKAVYSVGEQLQVNVPTQESKKLNYMVLANSHSVVSSGRVRDDGVLTISLSSKFLGRCVLFVYSTSHTTLADMIQFYVKDNCSASVFSSKNEMKPGQNVTFTLNGDPYGMAVLRATDDRLNYIQSKAETQKARSWDFGMFDKGDAVTQRHSQAKLTNFVRVKELRNIIEKKCQKAAMSYKNHFGRCPEAKVTSSCISNHCIKWMVEACLHPPAPTTSSVCNEHNQSGCRYEIQQLRKSGFASGMASSSPVDSGMRGGKTPALSDAPGLATDEDTSKIRENFEEIWIFDSYGLGASGTTAVTAKSPDSIGKWSVSSAFWSPGQQELCPAAGIHVLSRKKVFMQVDLPRNIYVNETITVKISVSALNLDSEAKYSICMSEMSRKVCGDLGSLGQHGRPTYTRVVVDKDHPTDTKTFTIRFLATGPAAVLFRLRREESFPGKHHCDVGEILDAVRLKFFVAKRAETEEHTKQIILNAEKPLASAALNDAFEMENTIPAKNIIEVAEYRSPIDPQAVVTQIAASIHDTDTVYSFSVDLSKFLTSQSVFKEDSRRSKRGVLDYGNSFLSDVIKQLSIELYSFKRARMTENTDLRTLEYAENKIGTLISDLLRFSDCSNETACGFAEYGRPQSEANRSPLLTSTVASLLCEASADERLVCGTVGYLIKYLLDREMRIVDLHDMVDIDNLTDRQWFLNAMLLQVSKDCAAYQCTKNDAAWGGLYRDFYNLDESRLADDRSIAAVAYMGPNGTVEILRPKMGDTMNTAVLPYWTAGNSIQRVKSKSSNFDRWTQYRKVKSGDLLVNALGVLAFVSAGAESNTVDWDPLANWIFEQQTEDGGYETALDTYFAHRALYEYRSRKVDIAADGNLQVILDCPICTQRTINITETATEIYLPTSARNCTLTTKGRGKVKAGVRVLLTKRQRSRRGLTMDDYYPVRISVDQQSVTTGIIKQIVCLRIMSPMLKTIEITHGFFTGYSSKASHVNILANSTHMKLSALPTISSYAAHFILENLQPKTTQCYEVGVVEPQHNHEPIHLAPVAIVARHPINDVVGLVLISHPDQRRKRRSSTSSVPIRKENHRRPRKPRNVVDESIDTVCLPGGTCTCAETTCGVPCGMCKKDSAEELSKAFSQPNSFGAMLEVSTVQRVLIEAAYYQQIETKIIGLKGGEGYLAREAMLTIWLRDCNPRCAPAEGITKGSKFFIQGDTEALVTDADGRHHYVLRDMDRWEIVSNQCRVWTSAIFIP